MTVSADAAKARGMAGGERVSRTVESAGPGSLAVFGGDDGETGPAFYGVQELCVICSTPAPFSAPREKLTNS